MQRTWSNPCGPCACCFSICELIWSLLLVIKRALFSSCPSIPAGYYTLYTSTSTGFLEPSGRGLTKTIDLGWVFQASHSSLCLASDLCIFPICCRSNFPWYWLIKVLICEYSKMWLGLIFFFFATSFFWTSIIWFYARTLAYPVSGIRVGYGVLLMEYALGQVRYWLVTPTNILTPLH